MNEEKLHDLQITLAHQDQQIQDLSDMVAKQWDVIETLRLQMTRLQHKVNVVEENAGPSGSGEAMSVSEFAASQKPPHY